MISPEVGDGNLLDVVSTIDFILKTLARSKKSKLEIHMLCFGTRKTYVMELSEYELLEVELTLENGNDELMVRTNAIQIDTQQEKVEDEFFALFKDEVSESSEESELCELEKGAFVFLDMKFQDNEPVDPGNKMYQHQLFGPLEMEKLEEEVFALLETLLEDDNEPIDEDILFPARKPLFMDPEMQDLKETFVLLALDDTDPDKFELLFNNIKLD